MANPSKLILAFVTLILGVALLTTIADLTEDITIYSKQGAEAKTFNPTLNATVAQGVNTTTVYTLTNRANVNEFSTALISAVYYWNGSLFRVGTVNTDYTVYPTNGTLRLLNTSFWLNGSKEVNENSTPYQFLVNYTYPNSGYLEQAWARTGIQTVSGLFALALLAVSVALFFSYYQEIRGKG